MSEVQQQSLGLEIRLLVTMLLLINYKAISNMVITNDACSHIVSYC